MCACDGLYVFLSGNKDMMVAAFDVPFRVERLCLLTVFRHKLWDYLRRPFKLSTQVPNLKLPVAHRVNGKRLQSPLHVFRGRNLRRRRIWRLCRHSSLQDFGLHGRLRSMSQSASSIALCVLMLPHVSRLMLPLHTLALCFHAASMYK